MRKRFHIILVCLIGIAILSATMVSMNRISVEKENNRVDIVLDYDEFSKMAQQSTHDIQWWFKKFRGQGVGSVALLEESLESMMREHKPIEVQMVGNILKDIEDKEKYPDLLRSYIQDKKVDEYDVLAMTKSQKLYQFIQEGLKSRYSQDKFKTFKEKDKYFVILNGTVKNALFTEDKELVDYHEKKFKEVSHLYSSKLLKLSLGFDEDKIRDIQEAGLKVIPRPYNDQNYSGPKYVKATTNEYEKYGIEPNYMIFAGAEVLGYKKGIHTFEEYVRDHHVKLGMIESSVQREHLEQDGLDDLVRRTDYKSVRVFSLWNYIQKRFKYYNYKGAEEIGNSLFRAIVERNIRVVYFKPFKHDERVYVTDLEEYEKMFQDLKSRIERHGLEFGKPTIMDTNHVRVRYKVPMAWGIIAGAIILLIKLLPIKTRHAMILLGIGMVGSLGMILKLPDLFNIIFALGAAVIFPSLSGYYICKKYHTYYHKPNESKNLGKWIVSAIKDFILASGISFIGSLMVGSILSDTDYLLEMSIFRGVKIAQLLPIVIFIWFYLGYFGYKRKEKNITCVTLKDIKQLLLDPIKVIHVLIGIGILTVGYVYIARTGHETSIGVLDIEMIFRNELEKVMFARPRTKEFLFAFPALMMSVVLMKKKYKIPALILGLGAIIGQTSIVNTFCHLRTPMLLSIIRTITSVGLGIVIGSIGVMIIYVLLKFLSGMRGARMDD